MRLAIDRVVEMDEFWRFMAETRGSLKPGSFEPEATPYSKVADLIGCVRGGNARRATNAGRRFVSLLKARRNARP